MIAKFKPTQNSSLWSNDITKTFHVMSNDVIQIVCKAIRRNHKLQIQNAHTITVITHRALVRLFTRMDSHVDEKLVSCIEGLSIPWAGLPHTCKVVQFSLFYVCTLNMLYEVFQFIEGLHTSIP